MATSESLPTLSTSADKFHRNVPRRRGESGVFTDQNGDAGGGGLARGQSHAEPADPPLHLSKRRRSAASPTATSRRAWTVPLLITATFLTTYALHPYPSNPAHRFIFLSYPEGLESSTQPGYRSPRHLYGKGFRDLALVGFYAVLLTFAREFLMREVFAPLARRVAGLSPSRRARLMEQMYTALYFGLSGPAGLYVMRRTPVWYFDTRGMFETYPHHSQEGVVKFFYLFQAAYWTQQAAVLVLGMEKPRKDFRELVAHHVVTLALIWASYRYHFTYIGLAVFPTHDISDFFLATSKMLKYLDSVLLAPYYVLFMACWIYMRHYLNLRVILSLFTDFKDFGPYYLDYDAGQFKCDRAFYVTLGLLSSLQALNLFWLVYIVRIAWRFVRYSEADDVRSEGEEEEGEWGGNEIEEHEDEHVAK